MKIKLLEDRRIPVKAGETVEVDEAVASLLIEIGAAVRNEEPEKKTAKKATKKGDAMAIVTLEDMEGEVTLVVFPQLYRECAATLAGEVDETGATVGNVFVRVRGKLERSDRGNQVICQAVEAMVLDEQTNRPKLLEVSMPPRMLSYDRMQRLNDIFSRYVGMDHVQLLVRESGGSTMRMELPSRVDAHNMVLLAEGAELFDRTATVKVV